MKTTIYVVLTGWLLINSCKKYDDQLDYRNFFNGQEIVYTGAVLNVIPEPGNLEIGLKWKASTDPSIVKYIIYYNNKADSQVVTLNGKPDTIRTVIKGLSEYSYSFTIYSADAKGNRSIPVEVDNAKVYGPEYISTLLNRGYDGANPYTIDENGNLRLNFITPDTINITTTLHYVNKSGDSATANLSPDSSSVLLPGYRSGSSIIYNSSYIPVRDAIDVFYAPKIDTFPVIDGIVACNKALFRKAKLPFDMDPYESDTDIDRLWNGSTVAQGFPNVFHSNGSAPLPGTFTFDLGRSYGKLTSIQEIGRNCCHNPDDFEVWGIADTTGAANTLAPNDPGWKAEALSKGWTLLQEVKRTDDGQAPFTADLISNPPTVRFIRIRVIHNSDGEPNYTNLSQITLFANLLN
ncbi:MAG: DUF4998 domain-containing protein [Bacteroidota bacterium]